jgi:hypothetical protein
MHASFALQPSAAAVLSYHPPCAVLANLTEFGHRQNSQMVAVVKPFQLLGLFHFWVWD